LKFLKEKPIISIRIKAHLSIPILYLWGTNFLRNKKKFISKGLLKTRFNSNLSKAHNHHLVMISQNNISELALLFNYSTHVYSK
jgi:hypothetical protein